MNQPRTRRQTERALLGSALTAPELLRAAELAQLSPEDFAATGHREIWRATRSLLAADKPNTPADVEA